MKIRIIPIWVLVAAGFIGCPPPNPNTNNPPGAPSLFGPSSGYAGASLPFSARAIDPDGDSVAILFDWGDGTSSSWTPFAGNGATVSDTHRWVLPGTYLIRAQAKDIHGDTSAFSTAVSLRADTVPANAPHQPSQPSGPHNGVVGQAYTFSSVTTDPDNDSISYQFDWNDGSADTSAFVPSGSLVSLIHTYHGQGFYYITVKAKDKTNLTSLPSDPLLITIIPANSPPVTPAAPQGPASGITGTSYTFYAWTTDPDTDKISYKFDWGDGSASNWSSIPITSGDTTSMSHSWSTEGTYQVKIKAKDVLQNESGWSNTTSITISRIGYVVNKIPLGSIRNSSPAVGADGTIYVGSMNTLLYAVKSGIVAWQAKTTGAIESTPLVGSDNSIYVGSDDGNLYKIRSGGAPGWNYKTGGPVKSSPAMDGSGNLYVGSDDDYFYKIAANGTLAWKKKTGGPISSSPAIDNNNLIYVGSEDGKVYCYNASGALQWSYTTGGPVKSSPAVVQGKVYVGSDDGYCYCLASGALVFKVKTDDVVESSPAVGTDGKIYVGASDGYLYCINVSGDTAWRCQIGGELLSSPLVGSDGIIYIGTSAHSLCAVHSDGSIFWNVPTDGIVYSSPALTADGTVYVGSDDGNLYAIKGTGQLASSVWPMFRHDLRHSGRVGGP